MATVPNYYYNAPWMADIGRNLASALAPPDPTKILERQQREFDLQNAQTHAANESQDRAFRERSNTAIGEMYKLRGNPILNEKGEVDQEATDRKAYELAEIAEQYGGRDAHKQVEDALFEASSSFRQKKLMQQIVSGAASSLLAQKFSGMRENMFIEGGIRSAIQDQEDAAAMARLLAGAAARLNEWNVRGNIAARNAGLDPITITQGIVETINTEFAKMERSTGRRLADTERLQYTGEASDLTQTMRNPVTAARKVWAAHGLGGPETGTREEPDLGSWINSMMKLIDPTFDPTKSHIGQTHDVLESNPAAPAPTAPAPGGPSTFSGAISVGGATPPDPNLFNRIRTEAEAEAASRAQAAKDNESFEARARQKAGDLKKNAGKKPPPKPQKNAGDAGGKKETPEERKARLKRILEGKE